MWNPLTGLPLGRPLHASARGGADGVAFSPNGKLLASAGGDGTVRLWNPLTRHLVRPPFQVGAQNPLLGVAFSANGKLLATAGGDGTIRLWDPVTGQAVGVPLQTGSGPLGGVHGIAFSPNGKLLASVSADGAVRLWTIDLFAHPYAALCADVGSPTPQEWNHYAPNEPQPKVCA
jgi:WD40 repeat protein